MKKRSKKSVRAAKTATQSGPLLGGRTFDVLPDRLDLRDRVYTPPLVSLPTQYPAPSVIDEYLPSYADSVLDQGTEGACTGFGLAAVINFLQWTRYWRSASLMTGTLPEAQPLEAKLRVSQRMLYQMARYYDEWEGEDYEGSSCRGAMKGWHKHGVCRDKTWPYKPHRVGKPKKAEWQEEATNTPLGAYYRIDKDSINDLQSAVFEIGAIYVSANVHNGWGLSKKDKLDKATIATPPDGNRGGHAFAIVGFNSTGFIVQNSWGPDWGFNGFALLPYDDWLHHGTDAWAAALGVPIRSKEQDAVGVAGGEGERLQVRQIAAQRRASPTGRSARTTPVVTAPWDELTASNYTVIQADNGTPLNRQITAQNPKDAVKRTCFELPSDFFNSDRRTTPRLLFYAHGGLNSQDASYKRIRVMGPYFRENRAFPIFYTWRTGIDESISRLVEARVDEWVSQFRASRPAQFDFADLRDQMRRASEWVVERWDSAIEAGCRSVVKPIWSDMKLASSVGTDSGGALRQIVDHWKKLNTQFDGLEIHLVGHSAGSLVLGELLKLMKTARLKAASCTLWAPACTVDFALKHYRTAITNGTLDKKKFFVHVLSDRLEREDTVSAYRKSLLYLVSRALETEVRAPLLGMEMAWKKPAHSHESPWSAAGDARVAEWVKFCGSLKPQLLTDGTVFDGVKHIPSVHGAFDNSVSIVEDLIKNVTGNDPDPRVTDLTNF